MTLDRKNLILLSIALLSAILAAWAVRSWMLSQVPVVVQAEAPTETVPSLNVLVAQAHLPAGLIVTAEHLKWQPWPAEGLTEGYITQETGSMENFVGSVTREVIAPGEPITATRMVKAGDRGFLAAVLTPDMRAISIPINATTGISGLLFPGDRIDLIVTHQISAPDGAPRRASETVLTNIRILAIDQRTQTVDGAPALGKNVTIEVTPKQLILG